MAATADMVIVGGGIVGASAAYHRRADGFTGRVLVVDPDLTHIRAATPASMGGVRTQYGVASNRRSGSLVDTGRRLQWHDPRGRVNVLRGDASTQGSEGQLLSRLAAWRVVIAKQHARQLQEIVEAFHENVPDDVEIQLLIVVHGDVAEAHHLLEARGQ